MYLYFASRYKDILVGDSMFHVEIHVCSGTSGWSPVGQLPPPCAAYFLGNFVFLDEIET